MKINDKFNLIRTKESRNRILMPPMDTLMAEKGMANDFHIQHYGAKAYGGVGTIIVESSAVSPEGRIRAKDLGIWSDEHIEGHKKIAAIAHKAGAVIGVQINHAGSKAEMADEDRIGPTKFYDYLPMKRFSLITKEQIEEVIEKFVQAAKRAKTAGYDFVEIHAAHGYLLSTMLHKDLNEVIKSDDILVRGKMLIDIAERISKEVKIPFGVRISFSDHNEGGMEPTDFKPAVEKLSPLVSYFNVSSGETTVRTDVSKAMKEAGTVVFRLPIAKEVKTWTDKNVIVAGNISTRENVDEVISAKIDGALIGREILFNPYLVVNSLLKASEIDKKLYHWNDNIWFSPHDYAELKEKLSK